jgi:hypothetical protein
MHEQIAKIARISVAVLALAFAVAIPAHADLQDYAPTVVTVTNASGVLLAADNQLQVVTLANTGSVTVWVCHASQTAVVGRGFYLPAGGVLVFNGLNTPQQGLKAIATTGTCTVAIGRG